MNFDNLHSMSQRRWFAYMEDGKFHMGLKHHYLTKNERMRFFYFLHKNENNGWKLKRRRVTQ